MDKIYMKKALDLAKKGEGRVSPNPMVGAVIVKGGKIIGEGYHQWYGGPHAEVNAFLNATENVEGATIYVTLEPCCHFGKTPPCVNAIIENKISRVVVGALDPNPLVAGKGIDILKNKGIEVITGVLEEDCKKINEVFMKYILTKKPFIIMKAAMTLDGKIASYSGNSKWITGDAARGEVHKLRNSVSGIMVGIGTVLSDNPELTCRMDSGIGKDPIRIIVDSNLRIPLAAKVIDAKSDALTIVATTENANKEKIDILRNKGVEVLIIKERNGRVDLQSLMEKLGELKIDSILLEGGSTLNFSALEEKIVDKVQFYIAPKIIGGEASKTPVGGGGISLLTDAFKIKDLSFSKIGEDILIEGYL